MNCSEFSCEGVCGPAWGSLSVGVQWPQSRLSAYSRFSHLVLPVSLHLWSKTPTPFNKVGRRQKLLQESSQPSLAHQSRKGIVGVKQALPGGIQAPPPVPRLPTVEHPNGLRLCSTDGFCSPCFYFRFDMVTMITVTNIPQKLPGDSECTVSRAHCSPILHWRHKMTVRTAGFFPVLDDRYNSSKLPHETRQEHNKQR